MADFQRRLQRLRRREPIGRVFRDRNNPLEYLSRSEIRDRYRFEPESIIFIVGMLFNASDAPTRRSAPVPPLLCVLVTLQFFASDAHYIIIGDAHELSKSSVCRAVIKTTKELCICIDRYVNFPSGHEIMDVQREFYNIARFPKVVGLIDGTHIPIKGPSFNEPDYVNRKGFHSVNVQMVCDARFRVRNIAAKWPGSVHDSRIFRECELGNRFERGEVDGLLLGDSGYACKDYLMTPYLNPRNGPQERFNAALVKTRVLIEQTFGYIKRRFPCLAYGFRGSPLRACQTTAACVILHNLSIERGDSLERWVDIPLVQPNNDVAHAGGNGPQYRDILAATYFA